MTDKYMEAPSILNGRTEPSAKQAKYLVKKQRRSRSIHQKENTTPYRHPHHPQSETIAHIAYNKPTDIFSVKKERTADTKNKLKTKKVQGYGIIEKRAHWGKKIL